MASRNGPASAGSCMAVTETSPSILDPMCGKMRGHSDMLHPHRIAVKLGRSKGMPLQDTPPSAHAVTVFPATQCTNLLQR